MAWSNLYAAGEGGIHITIFENCKSKLVATDFPNKEPCFGKFMRVARLRIVIFRKQVFGISELKLLVLKKGWDMDWMSLRMPVMLGVGEILTSALIGFCGVLIRYEIFLVSLTRIINFW